MTKDFIISQKVTSQREKQMVKREKPSPILTVPSLVSDICKDNMFYSKVLNELEPCEYFKYYVMQNA